MDRSLIPLLLTLIIVLFHFNTKLLISLVRRSPSHSGLKTCGFLTECGQILKESWQTQSMSTSDGVHGILSELSTVSKNLKAWDNSTFDHVSHSINRLQDHISRQEPNSQRVSELPKLKAELNDLLQREEVMWKQRSRVEWLREGDLNINFFHQRASTRYKKNRIVRLQDAEGVWQYGRDKIE